MKKKLKKKKNIVIINMKMSTKNIYLLLTMLLAGTFVYAQSINFIGKTKPYENYRGFFTYNYGSETKLSDSVHVGGNGVLNFTTKDDIIGGVFYFEMPTDNAPVKIPVIISGSEKQISFKTDINNIYGKTKFKGSNENKIYYKFLKEAGKQLDSSYYLQERNEQLVFKTDSLERLSRIAPDKKSIIDAEILKINKELAKNNLRYANYYGFLHVTRQKYIDKYPGTFLAKYLSWFMPFEQKSKMTPDESYNLFKKHFFDNIDLDDDRLVKTKIYEEKLDEYFDKRIMQNGDSIFSAAKYLLTKTEKSKEVFKYTIEKIRVKYANSKIKNIDKLLLYIYQNYYLNGKVWWLKRATKYRIQQYVDFNIENQIGMKIPPLEMSDTTGKKWNIYDVKSPYTLIFFWSATCGHCKHALPILQEVYKKYNTKGFEVYSICINPVLIPYKQYVEEHPLPWIDTQGQIDYKTRKQFNMVSTPCVYLLDKDKTIIEKKFTMNELDLILEKLLN